MKSLLLSVLLLAGVASIHNVEASRHLLSTTAPTRQLKVNSKGKGNSGKNKHQSNISSALRDPATDLYARWASTTTASRNSSKKKNRKRPPPPPKKNKSPKPKVSPKPAYKPPSPPPPKKNKPPPPTMPGSPKPPPPPPSPRNPMPSPSFSPPPNNGGNTGSVLSGAQRSRAQALTNIFEFSDTKAQYAQAENLGDGRGITFGCGGFCTGTGDGLAVIEEYVRRSPGTSGGLAVYLPALRVINDARDGESNGSLVGLAGFEAAVIAAATTDQAFRDAQDAVLEALYFTPSQAEADRLGLKMALSRGQLYDAYFQHGENDPDDEFYPQSANGLAELTSLSLGGSPAQGVDELMWLSVFLSKRKQVLLASDSVWIEAANRVEIYEWLLASGVTDFGRSIRLNEAPCTLVFPGVCSVTAMVVEVGPSAYASFYIP